MTLERVIDTVIEWCEAEPVTRTQVNELIKALYEIKQTLPDRRRKVDRTKSEHIMRVGTEGDTRYETAE